jgi:hypothetical protein
MRLIAARLSQYNPLVIIVELPPPYSTPLTPRAKTSPKRVRASTTTPILPPPCYHYTTPPLKLVNLYIFTRLHPLY